MKNNKREKLKKKKRILIISGGILPLKQSFKRLIKGANFIICANGGYVNLKKFAILPDMIIGDLDSLPKEESSNLKSKKVDICRYPCEKDKSDLELAFEAAIGMNPEEIIILGAVGKRIDHTLFNISLLFKYRKRKVSIKIITKYEEMFAAKKRTVLNEKNGTIISLVPFSNEVTNIRLEGFFYLLNGETLYQGSSRGLSNILTSSPGTIEYEKGNLLVIVNRK